MTKNVALILNILITLIAFNFIYIAYKNYNYSGYSYTDIDFSIIFLLISIISWVLYYKNKYLLSILLFIIMIIVYFLNISNNNGIKIPKNIPPPLPPSTLQK